VHLLAILAIAENKQRIFDMVADFVISSYQSKTGVFTPEPLMPAHSEELSDNSHDKDQYLMQLYESQLDWQKTRSARATYMHQLTSKALCSTILINWTPMSTSLLTYSQDYLLLLSIDVHCVHALIKNLSYDIMQKMTQGNIYFHYGKVTGPKGNGDSPG